MPTIHGYCTDIKASQRLFADGLVLDVTLVVEDAEQLRAFMNGVGAENGVKFRYLSLVAPDRPSESIERIISDLSDKKDAPTKTSQEIW